ncbi:hypothetical protein [Acetivibrio cellulolyticus]|uniref:hypothetical protein n=1 Tax=Acetivibrio cellulolyticus TaxID=35830 RepID=UPI0001E2F67B|nr:hypothetical protein [Acetivibrio cellulolyticus]
MVEVIYKTGEAKEIKEYKKFQKIQNERLKREGLKSFIESVKNNKDLFDREYYIKVLEEKGIKIEG